jgi:hypothetical protein
VSAHPAGPRRLSLRAISLYLADRYSLGKLAPSPDDPARAAGDAKNAAIVKERGLGGCVKDQPPAAH